VWLAAACLLGGLAPASAEWYLTPYFGFKLGGSTNIVDPEGAASDTKLAYGATLAAVSPAGVGLEVDVGMVPDYFQRGTATSQALVTSSRVWSAMGNVFVAPPERLTRYTLRPYVSGGMGLLSARIDDIADTFPFGTMVGMNVGGGAMGFFTERAGIRWDLRYFRNLTVPKDASRINDEPGHLTYWRATVGAVIKY
jgi:hypothetical protein